MSASVISALKNIYDRSGLPAAITDNKLCIIWKNRVSSPLFNENKQLLEIFGGRLPVSGLTNIVAGEELYSFNILKTDDHTDSSVYYVIEIVRSEKIKNILNTPAIKDYILYICAKIKNMAGTVTNSADEIYDAVSCGLFDGAMITERLNTIDEGMMSITKEVIPPDQFYSLVDMKEKEVTLSMDNELRRAADEASDTLGKKVKITCDCEKNIFFRMDRSLFETVIAGMTADCCSMVFPDMLIFSAERTADNRALISVTSLDPRKRNVSRNEKISEAPLQNPDRNMFFDYICDICCSKFGAVFTRTELPDGYLFKMEINILSKGEACIAMTSSEYSMGKGHFGKMALMLADCGPMKRYVFYDIDTEEAE